jgi:4-amino-4-deoxy-L-arabinose transferase-like glycosyltransferase
VPALLLLATFAFRALGFLAAVIDTDEGLYLVQAREWLRGGWPYLAVWDMHPVGAPGLIALGFLVFGESIASVRLLGALAAAATGTLLFRALVLAGGGRLAGLTAGLLYVAYSIAHNGAATNTENLFAPFVTAGYALALLSARQALEAGRVPGAGRVFGMGLCFGMALWVKQLVVPEAALAFLGLAGVLLARRLAGVARLAALALAFGAGCALPTALTALAYALRGELAAFIEANVTVPLLYPGTENPEAAVMLRLLLAGLLPLAWLLVAAAAALAVARRSRRGWLAVAGLGWFLAASAGVLLPGKFYSHYFLMLLPPLCLTAALGLPVLAARFTPGGGRAAVLAAVVLIASMPVLASYSATARAGFALRRPDPPRVVAAELRRLLPPGETAFLVNYEPAVYFLADLTPPTRMPFWLQLTGRFGDAFTWRSDPELDRVLAARPYLMVISAEQWPQLRPTARAAVEAALERDYTPLTSFQDGRGTVEVWRRR